MPQLCSEKAEQRALIKWASILGLRLVHHANERKCSPVEGRKLKALGLAPGLPDLALYEARGPYNGLFIELKANRRYKEAEMITKTWQRQEEWLQYLSANGYLAVRCFGWDEARGVIETYLSFPKARVNPTSAVPPAAFFFKDFEK